jgi:hypothetical protein
MTEHAGPEATASAAETELTVPEATAAPVATDATSGPEPPDGRTATVPRDAANWAAKVDRLQVGPRDGVRGTNVAGRRLAGPIQGFGKMLQKTYRMDLGAEIAPTAALAVWREHFPEFWPRGNKFAAPLTGINPGEVALLDIAVGGGVKLSTGVMVLYADAESFTLMTPQGHMFAGWITFSADREGEATFIQAQGLIRANDPLYELALTLGGYRKEDRFWIATMEALGHRLGIESPAVTVHTSWVDTRRQWRNASNVWHNSMIRSVLQTVADPTGRRSRRGRGDVPAS